MSELSTELPFVSILIAARNEEHTILDCLRAIDQLDYPKNRLQILIGDDASDDRTAELVSGFIRGKSVYQLITISRSLPNLNGKANVLAQLTKVAIGSLLFTTDADAQVPATWLKAMIRQFETGRTSKLVGVVNGCTIIRGNSLWAQIQAVECVLVFQLIAVAANLGIPLTGVGNNMAFRRQAYEDVGGFENLPFSVVEDYTLFQAIVGQGYGFGHKLDPATLVHMLPPSTLQAYLQQRKRWMRGVFDLPLSLLIPTLTQYLLGPFLLLLAFWLPALALGLYTAKVLSQTLLLWRALIKLRQTKLWVSSLLFEPYQTVFGLLAFVYYWLPTGVVWKGRKY